ALSPPILFPYTTLFRSQFGLVYWAMRADITAGLASLVVQAQVFFTIALTAFFKGERPSVPQWAALALAAVGYGVVAWGSAVDPRSEEHTSELQSREKLV